MNPETVFNRYDIRGTYPDEIDEQFAKRMGWAAGTYAQTEGRGRMIVGRDSRGASQRIYDQFLTGIRDTGTAVVDVGVGTTDRTALACQRYGGYGVMVTASHHDWERTGFKFLYPQGHGFTNTDLEQVKGIFTSGGFETGEGTLLQEQHEFDETYIDMLKDAFQKFSERIDATVVLDAVGGAERTAPLVFEELGATVITMDREELPDPEPTADSREDVADRLEKESADIAVGYDPDGDRVYVIHPELGWVDGDRLFYLLGRIVQPELITASIDTAPFIENLYAEVAYTRVGDIFVSEKGVEQNADLLGEPNGHYAVTDFCWYNSGIFASLLLAAHHDSIPDLLEAVDQYRTVRHVEQYATVEERDQAMNTVMKNVAQAFEVRSTLDGVKFETGDGAVTALARPSGTSPKIRLVMHYRTGDDEQAAAVKDTVFDQ